MGRWGRWAMFGVACAALAGCDTMRDAGSSVGSTVKSGWNSLFASSTATATADMRPTQGYAASGKVEFVQSGNGVHVAVDLVGLAPNTEHGFHVHERGDCSSSDAMSAGGHFNPEGVSHGSYEHAPHHAGDLPNVKADARGEVHTSFDTGALSVGSGAGDVVGKAVVVHREADDYKSQPAGNSGPRVSCGIIAKK
jgi:superoxide dismutase, Cu-Zn family